ncbi:[Pyruvate dehydrogenase (acetyl-transferring)] kinase, mitochondrial [Armadillidium vulgare]|nr:[Pyruvate dehydrogenase (acetyl-transferring)] kinase, mitochondrial [Armadillidium vulgare]
MRLYRMLFRQAKLLEEKLDYYSQFNPSPLSMQQFTDFGRNATNAESFLFLRKELPVRLANIMKEFSLLPDTLLSMPSVVEVSGLYKQSLNDLLLFEDVHETNEEKLNQFTESLIRIRDRHKDVVLMTAQGVMEMKEAHSVNANIEANVQYFLDRFYMNRISIRMLINQHKRDHKTYILKSPHEKGNNSPITVVYVPSHLYHMLFELFKNSMRAVVEFHESKCETLPPLEIIVVLGSEDLTIKLSDQGGGISRSLMDMLFNYMYSTAQPPATALLDTPPLAGYGYGLPLSRLYARYFHGDLVLTSLEGYGTDALIYLKAISSEANELLPVYNKTCQRQYTTSHQTNDWSSQVNSAMFIRPFSTSSKINKQIWWKGKLQTPSAI